MNRVIASYLNQFSFENSVEDLDESELFERFANFCLVSHNCSEQIDVEEITTSSDDDSIDGVAIIIDSNLISTVEDAKSLFSNLPKRRSVGIEYFFTQIKRTESFDLGEMLKLPSGVCKQIQEGKKAADEVLAEFRAIHEIVVKNLSAVENGRPTCRLYYVCTGDWHETNDLRSKALTPGAQQLRSLGCFHDVTYEPVDRERLIALWVKTRSVVQATFPVKGAVALPAITGVNEAYLTLAPARAFIKEVLTDEDGRLRTAVFEQNVRAFLGEDNPVNARMRDALHKSETHDRFVINNNGITIVSPDVRIQNDRISVSDFQIVNGCQTSHSLFRNRDIISDDVWVPVKVIEADAPDVISQLVESTNSQTHVDEAQFLSIRPFAQRVQIYFDSFEALEDEKDRRLYFERRTNQYAGENIGKARIFDIEKLARCMAAMFLDIPHVAYMYPTQVLAERRAQLYRSEHRERVYYTAALALYRLELALGNSYVPRKYQSSKWHLLMLVRYLVGGLDMPRLDSPKIEKYCERIDSALEKGGKASAPPFLRAGTILDAAGDVTRDRRKGQPYTDDLKKRVIANIQKKPSRVVLAKKAARRSP